MEIGYARVSTQEQNLDLQRAALHEAGCQRVFEEKVSGATRERPELKRLLDHLRKGDTVVVWLDRLARSTRDLLEIAESLNRLEAGLKSLAEPWADTTSPAGRMLMTFFAGIAEFGRELIRQRTSSGREVARARGVKFGKPRRLSPEQVELAMRLLSEGRRAAEVARTFGVHRSTIYRSLQGKN